MQMKYSCILFMFSNLQNVLQNWELLHFMSSVNSTELTFPFETFVTVNENG